MFDHTVNVWMHAKKMCMAIKEHLFSGWKGPFTHVCPEKQLAQKLNLQDMTANKLITIHMGKGTRGIQQGDQEAQMSTKSSHQNSNQKKAMEPAFYQTRCR